MFCPDRRSWSAIPNVLVLDQSPTGMDRRSSPSFCTGLLVLVLDRGPDWTEIFLSLVESVGSIEMKRVGRSKAIGRSGSAQVVSKLSRIKAVESGKVGCVQVGSG